MILELFTIFFISLSLALDAFAVSVAVGAASNELKLHHALRLSFFFGLFQFFMPLIGWAAGNGFKAYIDSFGHWVAFGLLVGIGIKMILEGFEIEKAEKKHDIESYTVLLVLAVATSLDALAVGVTISLITTYVLFTVIAIGVITFILSCLGCWIGQRGGHLFEEKFEFLGGAILILIGLKILITHYL